jgi:regulator of sigma E protease
MSFLEILVMVGQLLLALSILVTLHELGHFLTARWFGIRVDKFYIFFDFLFPLPNVLNFALFKVKKGGTEYGLGWFPLGGYVQIAGMIDESLELEKLKEPAKPDEFRSKPAWQRLIVMLGGIIVNVITGVVIFTFVNLYYGTSYQPADKVEGIKAHNVAQEIGLKNGDKIIKVNGKAIQRFDEALSMDVFLNPGSYYTVEREGKQLDIQLPENLIDKLADANKRFIEPLYPFKVGDIAPDYPAAKAGLQKGDKILKINNVETKYFQNLQLALCQFKGKTVDITINRKGEEKVLKASVTEEAKLGFSPEFDEIHVSYSFGEAFTKGTTDAFSVITSQLKVFGKIFGGKVSVQKSLSGPIGIASLFGPVWNWEKFWRLTGMLSMVLAFMNLLPIPALDGGHVIFLLLEMIMRRKLSDKFMIGVQQVGTVLILGLTVFAFANDLFKPKQKKYSPCDETAIVHKMQQKV